MRDMFFWLIRKRWLDMTNTFYIERSVIASVINSELEHELNHNYFTDMFHRKLVNGINRLKELGEYIDFETLRYKFTKANKWTFQEDNQLVELMTNTIPFSTQKIFDEYYKVITGEYEENLDRRFAI